MLAGSGRKEAANLESLVSQVGELVEDAKAAKAFYEKINAKQE
jgi:hypothetical protein